MGFGAFLFITSSKAYLRSLLTIKLGAIMPALTFSKLFKNFDRRLDMDDIDEFQYHLNKAVDEKLKKLDHKYKSISVDDVEDPRDLDGYKSLLEDIMMTTHSSKLLGYELSIIALYKKVEIKTKKIVGRMVPNVKEEKLSYFKYLCDTLPFIKNLDNFKAFNELRMLNNAIKHGGVVSSELVKSFPSLSEGDDLKDLDKSYERLLPQIKEYMNELVDKIYANYDSEIEIP